MTTADGKTVAHEDEEMGQMEDWVDHDGSCVPVGPAEKVRIRSRDGYETKSPMPAAWFDHADINLSDWRWPSLTPQHEIVAYMRTKR